MASTDRWKRCLRRWFTIRRRQFNIQAKSYAAVFVGFVLCSMLLAGSRQSTLDVIHSLSVLMFSSVPAIQFAKNSLRVWQIRTRRLGSFAEWADNPQEWLKN